MNVRDSPGSKSAKSPSPSSSLPPASYIGTGAIPVPWKFVSATVTSNSVVFPVFVTVYV